MNPNALYRYTEEVRNTFLYQGWYNQANFLYTTTDRPRLEGQPDEWHWMRNMVTGNSEWISEQEIEPVPCS